MDLSFGIFVVPVITLTLIITLYIHFFRKVVQGPLYKNFQYDFEPVSFCVLASIKIKKGKGLMK